MDPGRQPGLLQMHVDDIADQHAMRFDRALVPEGRVFLGPPALRVLPVIPLEVRRSSARMPVILPGRDQQVEVRLLAAAVEGRGIMKLDPQVFSG